MRDALSTALKLLLAVFLLAVGIAALEVQSLLQKMTMQQPLSSAVIRASMALARSSW